MKFESWKTDTKYDRGRPETTITSWAASILVFGYVAVFAIEPLQTSPAPRQTCTVIIDRAKEPIILHTNSFLHRAFVVTLKCELKFLENLLHRFV